MPYHALASHPFPRRQSSPPRKRFTSDADHGDTKAMQHVPRDSITDPHHAFERCGRHAVFRRTHLPCGIKPSRQRRSRFIENRSRCNRTVMPTHRTDQSSSCVPPRNPLLTANRTNESVGPPKIFEVSNAGIGIGKHVHEISVMQSNFWLANRCLPSILTVEELK